MGGRLQKIAAAVALASAFAGSALADDPNGLVNRAAAAGATTKNGGWTASLFVTRPPVENAAALGAVTTVGARLSRPISRRARLSVDVFNIFDKPAGTTDYFAATHAAPPAGIADTDFFHPADGRGIRVELKLTF